MPLPTRKDVALVSPVLTDLSLGYKNETLLWEKIAPTKGVPLNVGTIPIYTRDYWFRRIATAARGADGGYARTGYGVSSDTYKTVEIGFEKSLDDSIGKASQLGEDLQETDTAFLTTLMELEFEKRVAAACFVTSVWGTSTTMQSASSPYQWSDFDNSDPPQDVQTALRTIRRNTGSNTKFTMRLGPLVWEKLKEHPLLMDKIKHTQKGVLTEDLVASLLGLDELTVGYAIENTAVEKAPGTASFTGADIWTDNVLILAEQGQGQRSGFGAKTLIWEEDFSSPWVIETYRDDRVRSDITRIRSHLQIKIMSTQHGYIYLDCIA